MIRREWIREILALKRMPRTGWFRIGVETPESIASHSFSMTLLVWRLARATPGVDPHRCVLLALLHDVHETRLGDVPTPAKPYFPEGAILEAELAIVADQWADDAETRALVEEFLAGETAEAKLVAAVDHLEFLFQAAEYREGGYRQAIRMLRRSPAGPAWEHPTTRPYVEALLAELEESPQGI